ncbi:MAG: sulfatase [Planctomycetota bacterium]
MKYGLYGGLTAGLAPSLWLSGCRNRPSGKKPNIILIAVDTLRADHLSCSGYSRNTSPNINRFAEDSLLFENCLSNASETWSSFASLLSGFLPHETKAINTRNLPKAVPTLPKTLQRIGYKTVGVVSNYILRRKWGWDEGFTIFDDTLNERELVRKLPERIAEYATNRAIELLEQYHNEQLFMWIHYQDPHGPYTPPERFAKLFTNPNQEPRNLNLKKSLGGRGGIPSYQQLGANRDFHYYVSQYDGEIRYFDEQFHQLIDSLKNFGLYDDSLIIFTSDHGEEMGEHDYFFVHGNSLYNSLTHVPLIIKYGKELTGRRADYVQHIDIVPTILKMIGLKKDRRFRGSDLRRQDTTKKEIFAEVDEWGVLGGKKFSITLDGFKLIHSPSFQQYQLFDLKTDPHEERNLIYDYNYRKQLNDLKVRLERIRDEDFLNIRIPKKPQKLTEEEIEKLKSLGYAH